jgi:hypothetical protein
MRHQPEPPSSKDRLDRTLLAMIVSTGLLIAWVYSNARNSNDVDLRSGIVPLIPAFLDGE